MSPPISFFGIVLLVVLVQAPAPPQPVSAGTFVGTWVGLQTAADNTSPGVQASQTVTMTIEIVDGKLIGTLSPFFGGSDGASFVDAQIVGEELRASAMVGKPAAAAGGAGRGAAPGWKSDTKIQFTLKADRTRMKGTGDVQLSGVKWMQYSYDLEKKRSRY
jgi:hypothetical protein